MKKLADEMLTIAAFIALLAAVLCIPSGCVSGSDPRFTNFFPQKKTAEAPKGKEPDPEPMAIDQRTATNQVNLDATIKANAELHAKALSDEIQNRVLAGQIENLTSENSKLKLELSARDVTIGQMRLTGDKNAGGNINDPVISWILAVGQIGTVPFCFVVYLLAHRLRWFQRLKHGKNYRD